MAMGNLSRIEALAEALLRRADAAGFPMCAAALLFAGRSCLRCTDELAPAGHRLSNSPADGLQILPLLL